MDVKGGKPEQGVAGGSKGHVGLVEAALKEAAACPAGQPSKPYAAALLKLASGLPLDAATQVTPATRPIP